MFVRFVPEVPWSVSSAVHLINFLVGLSVGQSVGLSVGGTVSWDMSVSPLIFLVHLSVDCMVNLLVGLSAGQSVGLSFVQLICFSVFKSLGLSFGFN